MMQSCSPKGLQNSYEFEHGSSLVKLLVEFGMNVFLYSGVRLILFTRTSRPSVPMLIVYSLVVLALIKLQLVKD